MKKKQQQLTFEKGITNLPSDPLCSDNTLQQSLGLVFANNEHRVIQKPAKTNTAISGDLLYVHHPFGSPSVNYIYVGAAYDGFVVQAGSSVQAIGNILIVNDISGLHYLLWKGNNYKYLGEHIPLPDVEFFLGYGDHASGSSIVSYLRNETADATGALKFQTSGGTSELELAIEDQSAANDLIAGLYAKCKKQAHRNGEFCGPFMVCCAVQLYDGSYVMVTSPQLMITTTSKHMFFELQNVRALKMRIASLQLFYKAQFDYSEWSDIVRGVEVFVTDEALLYDTSEDVVLREASGYNFWQGLVRYAGNGGSLACHLESGSVPSVQGFIYRFPYAAKTEAQLIDDIKANSLFYHVCSLGLKQSHVWSDNQSFDSLSRLISHYVLDTLTNQERLPVDVFSRNGLAGSIMKTFNGRLHLGGVSRKLPVPDMYFLPYDGSSNASNTIIVTLSTPSGDKQVSATFNSTQMQGYYFYYPDPRAKSVKINGTTYTLEEHPGLNGAYFLRTFPSETITNPIYSHAVMTTKTDAEESLPGQLFVSEVNNPFVFRDTVAIDCSKILGLASQTTALSQGQFGQFPLLVFTDAGIWALQVGGTGVYTSAQPMSREVINAGTLPLETDGAVFFASRKGLMLIVGSEVRCVSEQLNGKPPVSQQGTTSLVTVNQDFATFLLTAFMAYDYRDSLIWIFDGATHGTGQDAYVGDRHCWVYAIKSGTFATFDFGTHIDGQGSTAVYDTIVSNAVADYPDYLLQTNEGDTKLLSFASRPNRNSDSGPYPASLVSRPMKLENGFALKTLLDVVHVRSLSSGATMTLKIEVSNDLSNWYAIKAMHNASWRYYRFTYTFTGLKAVDTFAGSLIVTQERYTNRLRAEVRPPAT